MKKSLLIAALASYVLYRILCAGADYVQRVGAREVERVESSVDQVIESVR